MLPWGFLGDFWCTMLCGKETNLRTTSIVSRSEAYLILFRYPIYTMYMLSDYVIRDHIMMEYVYP